MSDHYREEYYKLESVLRHDRAEMAEWLTDLATLSPVNWKELCQSKAKKLVEAK